ncbi:hypothetical protein [Pseudoxanthomonas sp. X-1]|uniref:DUF7666 domain-containing protein n=1 Tax=Pseudoxanthomonas sp. X-1 TaxID=2571115 RepID=UPI00110BDE8C|nr:hypothetical protein [Pseudoxanthomonas sp. X-1]TMN18493.1 hypothetical protein FF950_14530 [Pseudoxanthomonas sp. X-1]
MDKRSRKAPVKAEPQEVFIGYKGFDKDLACHPDGGERVQYKVGETLELEGDIKACKRGFHACEYPLDVFNYYPPAGSRFALVEQSGQISRHEQDSKVASSKIKVSAEIGLPGIIKAAIEYTFSRAKPEGETATGDRGAASATGDRGAASATGYRGAASATGDQGAAMACGYEGKAMGSDGNALFLAERDDDYKVIAVWAGIAGRDGIKADTWYTLRGGKPVEA